MSRQKISLETVRRQRNVDALSEYLAQRAGNAHLPSEPQKDWKELRSAEDYDAELPRYRGQRFLELLRTLPAGARWLDYGCGDAAVALRSTLQRRDMSHIRGEGVTFPLQRDQLCPSPLINRVEGHAFLRHHPTSYHMITARQSLLYSPDQLATLKLIYRALVPGGYALIDMISFDDMPILNQRGYKIRIEKLNDWLRNRNFDVEFIIEDGEEYGVTMRKNPSMSCLKLPIVLTKAPSSQRFPYLGRDLPTIQYVYRFIE